MTIAFAIIGLMFFAAIVYDKFDTRRAEKAKADLVSKERSQRPLSVFNGLSAGFDEHSPLADHKLSPPTNVDW